MLTTIVKWWDAGLHILGTMPPALAAFLIGWSFSIATTQPAKFLMPLCWEPEDREIYARIVAFLSAMVPAGLYYVDAEGSSLTYLWLVMIGTGLWSPIAFALLLAWLRRGGRESFIADVLTGDKRGVLAGRKRS